MPNGSAGGLTFTATLGTDSRRAQSHRLESFFKATSASKDEEHHRRRARRGARRRALVHVATKPMESKASKGKRRHDDRQSKLAPLQASSTKAQADAANAATFKAQLDVAATRCPTRRRSRVHARRQRDRASLGRRLAVGHASAADARRRRRHVDHRRHHGAGHLRAGDGLHRRLAAAEAALRRRQRAARPGGARPAPSGLDG